MFAVCKCNVDVKLASFGMFCSVLFVCNAPPMLNEDDVIRPALNWNAIGNDIALRLTISSSSPFHSCVVASYPLLSFAPNDRLYEYFRCISYNLAFNVNTDSTHLITYHFGFFL